MRKRLFITVTLVLFFTAVCSPLFAQSDEQNSEVTASKGGLAEVPAPKRPRPIDKEKAEEAAEAVAEAVEEKTEE